MMTIAEMKKRKKELGYTNKKIAEETGIPLGTIQKIFAGVTGSPRWEKMQALESLLSEKSDQAGCSETAPVCLREEIAYEWSMPDDRDPAGGADSRQGRYTVEDYLAMPEDRRVELIDGFIYDMAAPSLLHQAILRELTVQFYRCVEDHPECEMFFAPTDVLLGKNGRTVVQPDLFIICERKEPDSSMLNETPDFIIEILSPSNPEHDRFRKLNRYRFAGVREYWIIDPQNLRITVYDLEHDMDPERYVFEDTVPVGISGGSCSIDFQRIREKVERYLR